MPTLVLLRHGQSQWNLENRFTGWVDVSLTETGMAEAARAGRALSDLGTELHVCHTSYLKRAIKTLWIALETMDRMWLPVHRHWRLNERHYGALQGLNKKETADQYGDDQVKLWRRSFDISPPAITKDSEYYPGHDMRYAGVAEKNLPLTENLKDTIARVMPYWTEAIVPDLQADRNVLIAAHGNSLRALMKHLEGISDADINHLEIATGVPVVYELDSTLTVKNRTMLES